MKSNRQQVILDIVQRGAVASQGDIVRELSRVGIVANQATVSRDIQALGLVKVPDTMLGHRYALPTTVPSSSWSQVAETFRSHVSRVDGSESLVVVKTPPGHAHLVGVVLDGLRRDDIVGTVAGDDTLLVVPRDRKSRNTLLRQLSALLEGQEPVRRRSRTKAAASTAAALSH